MSARTETSSGGVGFFGLLGLAFIVLKLTGYIEWSWWWVTAPLWMPTAIALGVLACIALAALCVLAVERVTR